MIRFLNSGTIETAGGHAGLDPADIAQVGLGLEGAERHGIAQVLAQRADGGVRHAGALSWVGVWRSSFSGPIVLQRATLFRLLLLLPCLVVFCLGLQACSPKEGVSPPHEARFDVAHEGKRFCEVTRISKHLAYMFYLNFHYDSEAERAQTMDVFGFGPADEKHRPRLVVSVKLSISKKNEDGSLAPVYEKEIETNGANTNGVYASYHGSLSRLLDYVEMTPGFYEVCVESTHEVPYLYKKWVDFGISWSPGLK